MKTWIVSFFSAEITVEAEDEQDAIEAATEMYLGESVNMSALMFDEGDEEEEDEADPE